MIYGAGSALGAALGGAMADHLGWRWEFGVQVIPLVILCAIAHIAIPDDLGLEAKESFIETLRAFDVMGSLLLTVSITFFILGLVRPQMPGDEDNNSGHQTNQYPLLRILEATSCHVGFGPSLLRDKGKERASY